MARPEAPEVKIEEMLRPNTEVVDQYISPPRFVKSPLHEVAAALSKFDADLGGLVDAANKDATANKLATDKASFWMDNKEGAAEGVRQFNASGGATGIPSQAFPGMFHGDQSMQGHNDGQELKMKVGPSYETFDKTDNTPGAYEKWFRGFVTENSPRSGSTSYLNAWTPQVQQLNDHYRAKYVADRSTAVAQQAYNSLFKGVYDAGNTAYLIGAEKPDVAALGIATDALREQGYAMGLEKAKVDNLVIDAIGLSAKSNRSTDLLNALDHNPASGGQSLSSTVYGTTEKLKITHSINTEKITLADQARRENDRLDTEASNTAQRAYVDRLAVDPNATTTSEEDVVISKKHPLWLTQQADIRTKMLNRDAVESEADKLNADEKIVSGAYGLNDVIGLRGTTYKTAESFNKAIDRVKSVEQYNLHGGEGRGLTTDTAKSGLVVLQNKFKDPNFISSVFGDAGVTQAGRAAINEYKMDVMTWESAHPNARPMERQAFQAVLLESVLGRSSKDGLSAVYTAPPPGTTRFGIPIDQADGRPVGEALPPDVAPVDGPAGQSFPTKQVQPFEYNNPAVRDTGSTIKPVPDTPEWITRIQSSEAPVMLNDPSISKKMRAYIENVAASKKLDPQEILNDIHGRSPRSTNFEAAKVEMKLTPQEQNFYVMHMRNLYGPGGIDNKDGSRSTIMHTTVGVGDKTYSLPTVWDGKAHTPDEALSHAKADGLGKYPAYNSQEEAQSRYDKMHSYMEKDTRTLMDQRHKNSQPYKRSEIDLNDPSSVATATAAIQQTELKGQPMASASPTGPTSSSAKLAMNFFQAKGLSKEDSAAIVWNLTQESGRQLNTTLVHDRGTGYGIAGFRDPKPGKGRKSDLMAFAKARGENPASLNTQLEFVWHELNGAEKEAFQRILKAGTPEQKARAAITYLRPYAPYAKDRASRAAEVRSLLGDKA
jgi:hypothetical protein